MSPSNEGGRSESNERLQPFTNFFTPPKRLDPFHKKRHPKEMGKSEVTEFLTHLVVKRKVAASTQNEALSALLFLYSEVLRQKVWTF